MLNSTIIESILSDICNFQLVVFGFSISIFTLLFSLIMNKRDQLKIYSDYFKNGNSSPEIDQKSSFSISYISRLKKINKYLIIQIFFSFFLYLLSWFNLRIVNVYCLKLTLFYIIVLLSFIIILFIIHFLIFTLLKEYYSSTKI